MTCVSLDKTLVRFQVRNPIPFPRRKLASLSRKKGPVLEM